MRDIIPSLIIHLALAAAATADLDPSTLLRSSYSHPPVFVQHFEPRSTALHRRDGELEWQKEGEDAGLHVDDLYEHALEWLRGTLECAEGEYGVSGSYRDEHNGVYHSFITSRIDGLEVVNTHAAVHLDQHGSPLVHSRSWITDYQRYYAPLPSAARIRPSFAIVAILQDLGVKVDRRTQSRLETVYEHRGTSTERRGFVRGVPGAAEAPRFSLAYYVTDEDRVELVWDVQLKTKLYALNAWVNAQTGEVHGVSNWVSAAHVRRQLPVGDSQPTAGNAPVAASYRAVAFGNDDPVVAGGRSVATSPWRLDASPLGWHDIGDGVGPRPTLWGNNVRVQQNGPAGTDTSGNYRPVSESFNFDFKYDDVNHNPDTNYPNASMTNAFYIVNMMHDFAYLYGFDEKSGNFQFSNFGRGGVENDGIVANIDILTGPGGTNNAFMTTPPEGQSPTLLALVWGSGSGDQLTSPRDSGLDDTILVHEFAHGISARLTGGPGAPNCLGGKHGERLLEGWSDFFAYMINMKKGDTRNGTRPLGTYVRDDNAGIRN
ncbi:Fungalysin metallopeptidase-domain-containing protein, partial [Blyttiomyces helicus]